MCYSNPKETTFIRNLAHKFDFRHKFDFLKEHGKPFCQRKKKPNINRTRNVCRLICCFCYSMYHQRSRVNRGRERIQKGKFPSCTFLSIHVRGKTDNVDDELLHRLFISHDAYFNGFSISNLSFFDFVGDNEWKNRKKNYSYQR
jgi:hypothetical protein